MQRDTHFDVDDLGVFVETNLPKWVPELRIVHDTITRYDTTRFYKDHLPIEGRGKSLRACRLALENPYFPLGQPCVARSRAGVLSDYSCTHHKEKQIISCSHKHSNKLIYIFFFLSFDAKQKCALNFIVSLDFLPSGISRQRATSQLVIYT